MTTTAADAPLMLSVSGARGLVGRSMTPAVAATFAAAFGSRLKERCGAPHPTVVLGRDGRASGAMMRDAAAAGLAAVGARVVDLGVVATPTVSVMIDHLGAEGGMVVTASHNPVEWNGLKCLVAPGVAPPAAEAQRVIERYRAGAIDWAGPVDLPAATRDETGDATHVARVLAATDVPAIRARSYRVVLDSVNGGGARSGRMLLDALGCTTVHLHAECTGRFGRPAEPIEEHLGDLVAATRAEDAAVGLAQDPDADRLALVDETGRYVGEECTLALAAQRMLAKAGDAAAGMILATNLSTSRMIDDLAAPRGARVVRTAVGEANVAEALHAAGDRALLGGEGNGGVIRPDLCGTRDALVAIALVLEQMATTGLALSALVDALPRYAMVKRKADLAALGGRDAVDAAVARIAEAFAGDARIDRGDGVRLDFEAGWVHVRPSNTEPIARVIAEAATPEAARALADRVAAAGGLPMGG